MYNARKRIYVSMYANVWSLTVDNFIDLCHAGINDENWHLENDYEARLLSSKPKGHIYNILDWEANDWRDAIDEVKGQSEKIQFRKNFDVLLSSDKKARHYLDKKLSSTTISDINKYADISQSYFDLAEKYRKLLLNHLYYCNLISGDEKYDGVNHENKTALLYISNQLTIMKCPEVHACLLGDGWC